MFQKCLYKQGIVFFAIHCLIVHFCGKLCHIPQKPNVTNVQCKLVFDKNNCIGRTLGSGALTLTPDLNHNLNNCGTKFSSLFRLLSQTLRLSAWIESISC